MATVLAFTYKQMHTDRHIQQTTYIREHRVRQRCSARSRTKPRIIVVLGHSLESVIIPALKCVVLQVNPETMLKRFFCLILFRMRTSFSRGRCGFSVLFPRHRSNQKNISLCIDANNHSQLSLRSSMILSLVAVPESRFHRLGCAMQEINVREDVELRHSFLLRS